MAVDVRRYKHRSVSYGPVPSSLKRARGNCVRMNITIALWVAQALRAEAERSHSNMSVIAEDAIWAELQKRRDERESIDAV